MSEMKTAMLKQQFDFATWVAKRALGAVQNKAMLEKKTPPVVALGFLIATDTLLQCGESVFREAGYVETADKLAACLKNIMLAQRDMRMMVRDEVETLAERRPPLTPLRPVADLASVVTGMSEGDPA